MYYFNLYKNIDQLVSKQLYCLLLNKDELTFQAGPGRRKPGRKKPDLKNLQIEYRSPGLYFVDKL